MIDIEVFLKALSEGTPWAILIAGVGVIWQLLYRYSADKIANRKVEEQNNYEKLKYEHQEALEKLKFDYERRKWRERLALQLAFWYVDSRLESYPKIWSIVKSIAKHKKRDGALTKDIAIKAAEKIEEWRYSKGGLLAEETTRNAALALQTALWHYDQQKDDSFDNVWSARRLLRSALRADMGLGENTLGENIFDITAARQNLEDPLEQLMEQLGISSKDSD